MAIILGLASNVFFLGLVSLFNDFSAEMIISIMPAFLVSLGAAPAFIGFLEGFANALASVLKVYAGWFSDKIKKRKIISVFGYTLSVITRPVLYVVRNAWGVFVLRAIDRVGKGFREPPRDALLTESVSKEERGKSFGYQRAMDAFGGILGPASAVLLLPLIHNNYRTLFLIAFFVGLFALISFLPVKDIEKQRLQIDGLKINHLKPFTFSTRDFSSTFRRYIFTVFIFGLGMMPVSLLLLKIIDLGLPIKLIPLMYLVFSSSFAIFAIPFGRLSDKIGEKRVLIFGFVAAMVSFFILKQSSGVLELILGFAVLGLYEATTNGGQRSLASKLIGEDVQASGQGFLGAAIGLSSLCAGLIGGLIWTEFGSGAAFNYAMISMVVGLLLLISFRVKEFGVK